MVATCHYYSTNQMGSVSKNRYFSTDISLYFGNDIGYRSSHRYIIGH